MFEVKEPFCCRYLVSVHKSSPFKGMKMAKIGHANYSFCFCVLLLLFGFKNVKNVLFVEKL